MECSEGVHDDPPLGQVTETGWSGLGNAIRSTLPAGRVDEIVERRALPRATERTITTREALGGEPETVREHGDADEREEREFCRHAIAVPVATSEPEPGRVIAVSGPRSAIERDEGGLVEALRESANVVERRHGNYRRAGRRG